METGLILLAVIAAIVTLGFTKVRRRMGLGVNSKHWLYAFVATFLIILVIWANQHG
jgi:uncharacterized membrane protein